MRHDHDRTNATATATATSTSFELDELTKMVDVGWVLLCTALVFLMQGGFILLEIGSVREKNAKSILLKNLLDSAATMTTWWLLGYSTPFDMHVDNLPAFSNGWAFCATATTIVSGCVAERTRLSAYVLFSVVLSGFIYPMVVRWVWDDEGFLSHGTKELPWLKFHDFAGSVVVHVVGGTSGLVFARLVGPRLGRFINHTPNANASITRPSRGGWFFFRGWSWRGGKKESIKVKSDDDDLYEDESMLEGHDPSLVAIGTFLLWFGWYGFNAGSTGQLSDGGADLAARAIATTSMSASGAVLMAVVLNRFHIIHFTPQVLCNALLSGLVSITASCTIVELWSAILIGAVGALFAMAADRLVTRMHIDDPLQAFAVHGASGIWGGLAVGIFGAEWSTNPASLEQFASQVIGVLVIFSWTVVMSVVTLFVIHGSLRLLRIGGLRVPASEELEGLDTLFTANLLGGKKTRGVVAPEGVVTIVSTDVQGSTSLWANDPQSMSASTALHDHILRSEIARFGGYEITTEGDAFLIAFNSTVAAVDFCTQVQTALLSAEWPESILDYPECRQVHHLDEVEDDEEFHGVDEMMTRVRNRRTSGGNIDISMFHLGGSNHGHLHDSVDTDRGVVVHRGLRVRMGIDIGHCKRQLHPTTRTFRYKGSPITYAKALVGALPSGGVLAVTHRVQAELAGQMSLLKGSSLCHLGVHVINERVRAKCGIFAIVPSALEARLLRMKPLDVKFEIAPGYLSAPGVMPLKENSLMHSDFPERDASTSNLDKRATLSVHCLQTPEHARPIIIAFASLVLVEEMQTSAPNGAVGQGSRTLSDVIQRYANTNDGDEQEGGGGAGEGSVRRGVAYLSAMLGDSTTVMRSGMSFVGSSRPSRYGTGPPNLIIPPTNDEDGAGDVLSAIPRVSGDDSVHHASSDASVRGGSRHSRRGGGEYAELNDASVRSGRLFSSIAPRAPSSSRMSSLMSPATNPMLESLRNESQKLAGPLIRMSLATTNGYECQEDEGTYMVAFESPFDATRWASMLCRVVDNMFGGRFSVAVGMHYAMPTSISPHASSGRADYFGTVVNAAARVHSLAATRTCIYGRSTTVTTHTTLDKLMDVSTVAATLSRSASQNEEVDAEVAEVDADAAAATTTTTTDEDMSASKRKGRISRLSVSKVSGVEHDDQEGSNNSNSRSGVLKKSSGAVTDREGEGLPPIEGSGVGVGVDGESSLQCGMLFQSLGKHKLKGFNKPKELFTVVMPQELSFEMLRLEETIVSFSKGKTGDIFDEEDSDFDGSLHFWDSERYKATPRTPRSRDGGNMGLSDDD